MYDILYIPLCNSNSILVISSWILFILWLDNTGCGMCCVLVLLLFSGFANQWIVPLLSFKGYHSVNTGYMNKIKRFFFILDTIHDENISNQDSGLWGLWQWPEQAVDWKKRYIMLWQAFQSCPCYQYTRHDNRWSTFSFKLHWASPSRTVFMWFEMILLLFLSIEQFATPIYYI